MAVGDDYANLILDMSLGSAHATSAPDTVWLAAYYEDPDDSGGGVEASYPEYARVVLANIDTNFPPAVDRTKELAVEVEFPTPSVDTPRIMSWALHRHVTNDDLMFWDPFNDPIVAKANRPIIIEAGTLFQELASITQ